MGKHIIFAETEEFEREYITSRLGDADIDFFHEAVERIPVSYYADCEILSPFIYSPIQADTMTQFPNLKLIATRSTGYDHIDVQAAQEKGIVVCNVPTYGENTVAEHTFALLLALSRHIPESIERTKRGDFSLIGLQGFDLKGKTIGIIGTGNIGTHAIRMAHGFEMHILAYSRTQKQELIDQYQVQYVTLPELYAQSDIVSFHVPENSETHHMLNHTHIPLMKKGVIIINTARGGLIETDALVKALDEGHIGAIGLDVLEEEAIIKEERQLLVKDFQQNDLRTALENHLLLSRPNVIVTPHNAFNSKEAIYRILDTTIENILAFKENNPINRILA